MGSANSSSSVSDLLLEDSKNEEEEVAALGVDTAEQSTKADTTTSEVPINTDEGNKPIEVKNEEASKTTDEKAELSGSLKNETKRLDIMYKWLNDQGMSVDKEDLNNLYVKVDHFTDAVNFIEPLDIREELAPQEFRLYFVSITHTISYLCKNDFNIFLLKLCILFF